ncbi:protein-export chaperone SecB [Erythrobacter sanguineus]|jgi:preprotein translocase subunit SecB|uniref:Protein-export protein SecB n=1 Tax=Erythrobacter sanguineus TaxID=198312 RepID=A0A1M7SFL5_9SPHN|nr:protein-export chaperone SecB [Erythrobacter sanguineus]MCR9179106.1 protein-export chaperone SecB [Erythrobacteraceae bacterium]SHN57259.1 protein translocase subunit secB [Erythrobacter sanguineus]
MADEDGVLTNLDNAGTGGGGKPNGADTQPAVGIITQYVKDLSVENPNAPDVYQWTDAPQIDVQFNIGAESIGNDVHEVMLKLTLTASSQQGQAYIVDLAYCGLVGMRNIGEEQAHAFLYAEAPRLLFPFARQVVADAVRNAGFPPLMLDPIDFNGLYVQRLQARRAEEAAGGDPVAPVTGNS